MTTLDYVEFARGRIGIDPAIPLRPMGVGEGWRKVGWVSGDGYDIANGSEVFDANGIMRLHRLGYQISLSCAAVYVRKPGDGVFEPGLTSTENASKKV